MNVISGWNALVHYFDNPALITIGAVVLLLVVLCQLGWHRYNDKDGKQRLALTLFGPGTVGVPQFCWRDGLRMRRRGDVWQVLPDDEEGFRWEWRWTTCPYRLLKGEVVGNVPSRASK